MSPLIVSLPQLIRVPIGAYFPEAQGVPSGKPVNDGRDDSPVLCEEFAAAATSAPT